MKDLPASHPLYGSEQSKSGFGICYQFAIKCPVSVSKTQYFQGFAGFVSYSHSMRNLWLLQYVVVNIIIEAPYLALLYGLYPFTSLFAVKMRSATMTS